jgi:hypothetical protein
MLQEDMGQVAEAPPLQGFRALLQQHWVEPVPVESLSFVNTGNQWLS